MREILFRGKRKDNSEWMQGDLFSVRMSGSKKETYILPKDMIAVDFYDSVGASQEVIPETIGQYTGLCDKNGNKIFEGDIVKVVYIENRQYQGVHYDDEHTLVEEIIYSEENACYMLKLMCDDIPMYRPLHNFENLARIKDIEVIGNIIDNPELLEEQI